jgi:hypothetical protein
MQELERAIRLELAAQLVRDVLDGVEPLDPQVEGELLSLRRDLKFEAQKFRESAPSRRRRSDPGTKRKPEGQQELMGS